MPECRQENTARQRASSVARALAAMLLWSLAAPVHAAAVIEDEVWEFQVLLDDKPIGTHRYQRSALEGGGYRLVSEAAFTVKLLFATVYSYQHRAEERWHGGCLRQLESHTNDNGKLHQVQARALPDESGLEVRSGRDSQQLPGCVFSFAYWDPAMLERSQLLNSQDGEYLPVSIQPAGIELVTVAGKAVQAQRYELRNEKLAIDLWYSPAGRWLALESRTPRGQRLRYQLR